LINNYLLAQTDLINPLPANVENLVSYE